MAERKRKGLAGSRAFKLARAALTLLVTALGSGIVGANLQKTSDDFQISGYLSAAIHWAANVAIFHQTWFLIVASVASGVVLTLWTTTWWMRLFMPENPVLVLDFEVQTNGGLHGNTGERYWAIIWNMGEKTLENICLRALEGNFGAYVIGSAHTMRPVHRDKSFVIFEKAELHPDSRERVELFGLSYNPGTSNPDDLFNKRQTFELEVTAKDTPAVIGAFEYVRDHRPMIRQI